jgi:hypothetical protein
MLRDQSTNAVAFVMLSVVFVVPIQGKPGGSPGRTDAIL